MKSQTGNTPYLIFMGLYTILYALAFFPGIDNVPGYFGMMYGIIHPDSFPGDITGNYNPAMVSLHSILIKLGGDIWLDDRFNLLMWSLVVGFALWGLDKITRLLGVTSNLGRLAIFAVVMAYHHIIDNSPRLIDLSTLRPTTYAGPFVIWITYFLLKGKSLKPLLILSVLAIGVSVKTSWFIVLVVGIYMAREYLRWNWTQVITSLIGLLTSAFVLNYIWVMTHHGLEYNTALYKWVYPFEGSEANPFLNGIGPIIYVALLAAATFVQLPNKEHTARFKTLMLISIVVYVLGGIYYTFAPDVMKVPFFLALAVGRSTWLPQVLVFIVLSSAAVIYCQKPKVPAGKKNLAALALIAFYQFPFFSYMGFAHFFDAPQWGVDKNAMERLVVTGILMVVLFGIYGVLRLWMRNNTQLRFVHIYHVLFLVLIFSMSISVFSRLHKNKDNLIHLFNHGIMGGTPGAKWAGVNEYVREQTPKDATVVAMSGQPLQLDSALKIRTGRTMPLGVHPGVIYFDLKGNIANEAFVKEISPLPRYWEQCDKDRIRPILRLMKEPDYLVVPSSQTCPPDAFDYRFVKKINAFSIWKKSGIK